ncbi:hypothetical protein NEOKW01_0775 [Nematocida sp. AWRm80]|nr:hypothetical protein NEOKW01_0775 [Nematocida sp. AWRm80]
MLLEIVCLLIVFLLGVLALGRIHRKNSIKEYKKKPKHTMIINRYNKVPSELLEDLKKKYSLERLTLYKKENYQKPEKESTEDNLLKKESEEEIPYTRIKEYLEEKEEDLPDLIILCSKTSFLQVYPPYLLYKAEILHYKKEFSENILIRALEYYDNCEIRNGK